VLPGEEAEVLVHRQAKADDGDVGRELVEALDAARNESRPYTLDFPYFDDEIGERRRLAEERVALRLVARRQIRVMHAAVIDLAFENGAAAGAAHTGAAAIREHAAGVEAGLQDRLAFGALVRVAARLESYANA